jgi:hypothetical protein
MTKRSNRLFFPARVDLVDRAAKWAPTFMLIISAILKGDVANVSVTRERSWVSSIDIFGLEPKTFMVSSHLRLGFGAIKIYAWIGDINKFDFESLASMVWIQRHLGLELCTRVIVALDIYALSLIHL